MRQTGFTLTELLVALAIIGLVSTALMVGITSLNNRAARMNAQIELLAGGQQIMQRIKIWAGLAGYKISNVDLRAAQAVQIRNGGNTILFCYDTSNMRRQSVEFRLYNQMLQSRKRDNSGCTVLASNLGWVAASAPIIDYAQFSFLNAANIGCANQFGSNDWRQSRHHQPQHKSAFAAFCIARNLMLEI